tara:strand:+ start:594 stop:1952 length:1359 start_codon:yes stop_codon:yes gene_type:complete
MGQMIIMPKLGQTVEESTIVTWRKNEGERIAKGDIIFEIETDKAVLEVESFYEGTLLKVFVQAGETVPVSVPVAFVGTPGDEIPDPSAGAPKPRPAPTPLSNPPSSSSPAPAPQPPATTETASAPKLSDPQPRKTTDSPERQAISPRARALVRRMAIDAANIKGTGLTNRIVEADVLEYLRTSRYDELRVTPAAVRLASREGIDVLALPPPPPGERIRVSDVERALEERPQKLSRMRQVIAARLTQSYTTTPHFFVTVGVDMTDLIALRTEHKANGGTYTVTDFILQSVVLCLKDFPALNSRTDGESVEWSSTVNLGVAVSLDEGLVVPVAHRAGDMTMAQLNERVRELVGKAREGSLKPDEMKGSSFTVSNMGMLDVENFTAIINPGESGILAVSSTRETPAVIDGEICARSIMKITLSSDHRLVDGATAAKFANAIKSKLEDMDLWQTLM